MKRLLRTQLPAVLVAAAILGIGPAPAAGAAAPNFRVYITNDLPEPVVVRDCDNYCGSAPLDVILVAGAKVAVRRTTNNHDYLSVATVAGGHLGCVDLYFTSPQPGTKIPVSGAVQCPPPSSTPWLLPVLGVAAVLLVGVGLAALRPSFSR